MIPLMDGCSFFGLTEPNNTMKFAICTPARFQVLILHSQKQSIPYWLPQKAVFILQKTARILKIKESKQVPLWYQADAKCSSNSDNDVSISAVKLFEMNDVLWHF